jgi:hypothetical protein
MLLVYEALLVYGGGLKLLRYEALLVHEALSYYGMRPY